MHRGPPGNAEPPPPPQGSGTVDSLPKPFVTAMRTLFDIMDDKRTGYVRFTDIQNRWQDDASKGLPRGVIESLRKVTPPSGMLSFERFCGGLKICLLRNQVQETRGRSQPVEADCLTTTQRPPSAPLLDLETPAVKSQWSNTAAVRPNNAMPQQRALSMPQLIPERKETPPETLKPAAPLHGPPKPPRTAAGLERAGSGNLDKAEIRTVLQNWQMGLMMGEEKDKRAASYAQQNNNNVNGRPGGRGAGDGQPEQVGLFQKKPNVRRREPRRHTLQNGIDYNMLKRMKQIEQERDVLLQGLSAVEKAREWYHKQVGAVQEKMRYLGRMGYTEQWTEAQQERLDLQRARVLEVNRHLAALAETWERGGLPMHMNLAVRQCRPMGPIPQQNTSHEMLSRLKQQNRLLTEEVSQKSERVTALEREKATLIRELLQTRGRPLTSGSTDEAVF